MGFLPDLDENGRLKKGKSRPHSLPTTGRKTTYLEWDNLIINRCPSCGEFFPQKSGDRICTNHQGQPFKVPGFKFAKIIYNIENKDKFQKYKEMQ